MIHDEHKILFDICEYMLKSIKEEFPDLIEDPESIQYEWIDKLLKAEDGWIKLEHTSGELFAEMVENREWERSDFKMTLVDIFKSIRKEFPDLCNNRASVQYEWLWRIRNGLRKFDDWRLLYYWELDSDIPISSCEIRGGRKPFVEMLYMLDQNMYYPI